MGAASTYYRESFECAMDDAGCFHLLKQMTDGQLKAIGESLARSAENESLAIYRPSSSDIIADTERRWRRLLDEERGRTEALRAGAEKALRTALRLSNSIPISVTDGGEVYRSDGRTTRIL